MYLELTNLTKTYKEKNAVKNISFNLEKGKLLCLLGPWIPVFHIDDFEAKQKEYDATIAIITVPVEVAQQVTDRILTGGIRAL